MKKEYILLGVLVAVLMAAGIWIFQIISEYQRADQEYEELTEYIRETDEEDAAQDDKTENKEVEETEGSGSAEDFTVDFESLQQINPDIAAWLRIPGVLDYPVVQGTDNSYYLHHTFRKEYNIAGSIFLDARNTADFSDSKNIIYGHNMRNGSMFGTLSDFGEEEVYNKSKYFWIFTPEFIYQYRIFSASVVSQTGLTYQTGFSHEDFQEFIDTAFSNSVVDNTGLQVTEDDRIVTLSTCTGDYSTRFVVMGRLAQVYAAR